MTRVPWSDRVSPILVKEVRQALRGRYFAMTFWATLTLAFGLTVLKLGSFSIGPIAGSDGPAIFALLAVCFSWALGAVLPFSAFLSMGSEWDEGTFDLLVLSNLRPRAIFLGKLLSAGIQGILFYSAFVPFMAFAFLLGGIDVVPGVATLVLLALVSFAGSALAIGVSTLARNRYARFVLGVLLAAALAGGTQLSVLLASALLRAPEIFRIDGIAFPIVVFLGFIAAVAAFSFAAGTARLAHVEENRSTGLRATTLAIALVALGCAWLGTPASIGITDRELVRCGYACLSMIGVVSLFVATEPERLGRRVRRQVSRSPLLAFLSAPFLPGGGRGVLFMASCSLVVAGGIAFLRTRAAGSGVYTPSLQISVMQCLFGTFAYLFTMIGFPSALLAGKTHDAKARAVVRGGILGLGILGFVVPSFLELALSGRGILRFKHLGNPFFLEDATSKSDLLFVYGAAVFVTFIANMPRMLAGLREVMEASRERRHGDAKIPQAEEAHAEAPA